MPTIGVLALGILYAPATVPAGIAWGMVDLAISVTAAITLNLMGLRKENKDQSYAKRLLNEPLLATLIAPVVEEGIFRGLIQPLAARAIVWIVPTAAAVFLGTGLSIAVVVSVVGTAALFGYVHSYNKHKNSHIQATLATISGVTYGVLAAQFGLTASIAAHITNNLIVVTIAKLACAFLPNSNHDQQERESISKRPEESGIWQGGSTKF